MKLFKPKVNGNLAPRNNITYSERFIIFLPKFPKSPAKVCERGIKQKQCTVSQQNMDIDIF